MRYLVIICTLFFALKGHSATEISPQDILKIQNYLEYPGTIAQLTDALTTAERNWNVLSTYQLGSSCDENATVSFHCLNDFPVDISRLTSLLIAIRGQLEKPGNDFEEVSDLNRLEQKARDFLYEVSEASQSYLNREGDRAAVQKNEKRNTDAWSWDWALSKTENGYNNSAYAVRSANIYTNLAHAKLLAGQLESDVDESIVKYGLTETLGTQIPSVVPPAPPADMNTPKVEPSNPMDLVEPQPKFTEQ